MRVRVALLPAVVLLATPVWGHGELKPGRVAAASTVTLDLFLPSEKEGGRTVGVTLAMPRGFTPRGCSNPVGWTCAVGADVVQWRDVARVDAAVDFFFEVTVAEAPGTYTLPVQQTYADGEVATFAGPPGSADEAPLLTVLRRGASVAPAPTSSAASSRPPTLRPRSAAPSAGSGGPSAPGSTAPSPSRAPASVGAPSAVSSPVASRPAVAVVRPSDLPSGDLLTAASDEDGRSPLPWLAAGAVALGGTVLLVRRASRGR